MSEQDDYDDYPDKKPLNLIIGEVFAWICFAVVMLGTIAITVVSIVSFWR